MANNDATNKSNELTKLHDRMSTLLTEIEDLEKKDYESIDSGTNFDLKKACDEAARAIGHFLACASIRHGAAGRALDDFAAEIKQAGKDLEVVSGPSGVLTVPWVIDRDRWEDDKYNQRYSAARVHAKQLKKGADAIMEAKDFANVLYHSLSETEDYYEMTVQTVVKRIQKLLNKAYERLDKHETDHTNLFIAYFDLKDDRDV